MMVMFTPMRRDAAAVLLILLITGSSLAQATLGVPTATAVNDPFVPAPAPAPVVVEPAPMAPQLWRIDPAALYASAYTTGHGHDCGAGPPACAPYEDRNGSTLIGDPLLDNCPGTPGWLAGVELAGVVPHIKNRLTEPVTLTSGVTDAVHLPTAELGARVMPNVTFGYRFGQAMGELTVSYRCIVADGSQFLTAADLPSFGPTGASLRSRLDFQVLDIDYGSYEPSLGPGWDMKWRVGVRGTINYSDSQAANGVLSQQTTNRFWGIGPHAALDLRRWIGNSGFALFGRIDTSLPFGRLAQRFIEDTPAAAGEARFFENLPLLSINAQAGITWSPARSDRFRVTAGYTWEHWWDVGSQGVFTGVSREELNIQGGFARLEWNY
jgi:Legionella pneumophila major outer membrane protein precursor